MGPDLASAIADARRAAGLTQAELARRAGISPSYLSRIESAAWERGGPLPADGVLRALARALGVSSVEMVALGRAVRDRQRPGSGLGLAIVQDVAAAHGGQVFAAPRPGGGSVIGFELPR